MKRKIGLIRRLSRFATGAGVMALVAAGAGGADLPPEIEVDRLLVRAERQIAEADFTLAVRTLDRIVDLRDAHELQLPSVFWIKHAEASLQTGEVDTAANSATHYLQTEGRSGEHYQRALRLLDKVDQGRAERAAALEITAAADLLNELNTDFDCTHTIADGSGKQELVRQIVELDVAPDCRVRINTRYVSEDGGAWGAKVDTFVRGGNVITPYFDEAGGVCGPRLVWAFGSGEVVEIWFTSYSSFMEDRIGIALQPGKAVDEASMMNAVRTLNRLCET